MRCVADGTGASTELVALVDSDTIWAPDVAAEVCKPFADPRIGGVGTRQSVYGSKGFLARITDMFLDHRYFDENASQSLLGRAVSCLSGRTAVYRRALLLEIEHDFMDETFWGVPCLSGDDKRLTTLILARGHLTVHAAHRPGVVDVPHHAGRCSSSSACAGRATPGARTCARCPTGGCGGHPFLAYTMVDKGISSFTLLVGPVFMIYSLIVQNWVVRRRAGAVVADQPVGQAAAAPAAAADLVLLRPRLRRACRGSWP